MRLGGLMALQHRQLVRCTHGILVWLAVAVCAAFPQSASAYKFKQIYSFCKKVDCKDGNGPEAGLVSDAAGNLYGTTTGGGVAGAGTIFELTPDPTGTKWEEKVLYSFCKETPAACTDGEGPFGPLIIDSAGNLYGATNIGGAVEGGVAFELERSGKRPHLKVLINFCGEFEDCGSEPRGGLTFAGAASGTPYDGKSPLFGVTPIGSESNHGVVYEITPAGHGTWQETVVYTMCSQAACADGSYPNGELLMDAAGNLYGVGQGGGTAGAGVVFELTPTGGSGWSYSVLHSFCSACAEGSAPVGPLIADARGHLFGATQFGGANGQGSVYTLVPKGADSPINVLYSFCSTANCTDGQEPWSGPTLDDRGNLIGTASQGGSFNQSAGVIFSIKGSKENVLHSFCEGENCGDGQNPMGSLISDPLGNLYGVTFAGGKGGGGTVFELKR